MNEPSPVTIGMPALEVKRRTGAPLLFCVQDLWPESPSTSGAVRSPTVLSLVERLVRFIYRECDRILVQSLAFAAPFERLGVESDRFVRESRTGIAVSAEDSDSLAGAVPRTYKLPASRRRNIGLRGRSYVEVHCKRDMLLERLDRWLYDLARQPDRCAS